MPDRKNVVTGLKCCITHPNEYGDCMSEDCPYKSINCVDHLLQDALVLLQAQEPIEPIMVQKEVDFRSEKVNVPCCGKCKHELDIYPVKYNYCPSCGKAVKWDD